MPREELSTNPNDCTEEGEIIDDSFELGFSYDTVSSSSLSVSNNATRTRSCETVHDLYSPISFTTDDLDKSVTTYRKKSKRKKCRGSKDVNSRLHKSTKIGAKNNVVLKHTKDSNVISSEFRLSKTTHKTSDVIFVSDDDRHTSGYVTSRRGSAQEKENAVSHRYPQKSERDLEYNKRTITKHKKHLKHTGHDGSAPKHKDRINLQKHQKDRNRHSYDESSDITFQTSSSLDRSHSSFSMLKSFDDREKHVKITSHKKLNKVTPEVISFKNLVRFKDNSLMRKLLGSGTIQSYEHDTHMSNLNSEVEPLPLPQSEKAHSCGSDLNCEVGSVSSISSPEFSLFEDVHIDDDDENSLDNNLSNSKKHIEPENHYGNISSDSDIEVIIPEKKVPELIELRSDSDSEPVNVVNTPPKNEKVIPVKENVTKLNEDDYVNLVSPQDGAAAADVDVDQPEETATVVGENDRTKKSQSSVLADDNDDDDDVMQLRLAALRSAVLKKHMERVQRRGLAKSTSNNVQHSNADNENCNQRSDSPLGSVYCPSDRTSPLSPSVSSGLSVRDDEEMNIVEEQDMELAATDEEENCIENRNCSVTPCVVENCDKLHSEIDVNSQSNNATSQILGSECHSSETLDSIAPGTHFCTFSEVPPQPLPPGVEFSNLPPEFSHSLCIPQENACNGYLNDMCIQSSCVPSQNKLSSDTLPAVFPSHLNNYTDIHIQHHYYYSETTYLANNTFSNVTRNLPERSDRSTGQDTFNLDGKRGELSKSVDLQCDRKNDNEIDHEVEVSCDVNVVDCCKSDNNNFCEQENDIIVNENSAQSVDNTEKCQDHSSQQEENSQSICINEDSNHSLQTVDEIQYDETTICQKMLNRSVANKDQEIYNGIDTCSDLRRTPCENIEVTRCQDADDSCDQQEMYDRRESISVIDNRICIIEETDSVQANEISDTTIINCEGTSVETNIEELTNKNDTVNVEFRECDSSQNSKDSALNLKILDKSEDTTKAEDEDEDALRAKLLNSLGAFRKRSNPDLIPVEDISDSTETKQKTVLTNIIDTTDVNKTEKIIAHDLHKSMPFKVRKNKFVKNVSHVIQPMKDSINSKLKKVVTRKRKVIPSDVIPPPITNKKFIIKVGDDSDSGEDFILAKKDNLKVTSTIDNNLEQPVRKVLVSDSVDSSKIHRNQDAPPDLEKSVDLLLKQVREIHETKTVMNDSKSQNPNNLNKSVSPVEKRTPTSGVKLKILSENQDSQTPLAVRHLPKSQQEEYRRLKQQIVEKEKLNQQKLLLQKLDSTNLPKNLVRVNPTLNSAQQNNAEHDYTDVSKNTLTSETEPGRLCSNCKNNSSCSTENVESLTRSRESHKLLQNVETDLINERYNVLNNLAELDLLLSRMGSQVYQYKIVNEEVLRLREQLKSAEKNLGIYKKEYNDMKRSVSVRYRKLLESKLRCSKFSNTCKEVGSHVIGSSYILPKNMEDLIKNKTQEIAKKKTKCLINLMNEKDERRLENVKTLPKINVSLSPNINNQNVDTMDHLKRNLNEPSESTKDIPSPKRLKPSDEPNEPVNMNVAEDNVVDPPSLQKSYQSGLLDYISPLNHLNTFQGLSRSPSKGESNHDAILCPYDLRGNCMDEKCPYQH